MFWLLCCRLKVIKLTLCHYVLIFISKAIKVNSAFAELDESIVDALGILPQRKQHKKKLLVCGGDF